MLLDRLQRVAHNRAELRRLDGAGRLYATPHWRGGRYLYLIYPTGADGTRVRQYVGADRAKTAAALTAIANARRYDALADETRHIEAALAHVTDRLYCLIAELERVAPLDLATQATLPDGDNDAPPAAQSVTNGDNEDPPGAQSVTNALDSRMTTGPAPGQLSLSPL